MFCVVGRVGFLVEEQILRLEVAVDDAEAVHVAHLTANSVLADFLNSVLRNLLCKNIFKIEITIKP